jgi:spore cortex formation protein SpoVR/YcgB (stage V sporulation)
MNIADMPSGNGGLTLEAIKDAVTFMRDNSFTPIIVSPQVIRLFEKYMFEADVIRESIRHINNTFYSSCCQDVMHRILIGKYDSARNRYYCNQCDKECRRDLRLTPLSIPANPNNRYVKLLKSLKKHDTRPVLHTQISREHPTGVT